MSSAARRSKCLGTAGETAGIASNAAQIAGSRPVLRGAGEDRAAHALLWSSVMHTPRLRTLLLSIGFLGIAATAVHAGGSPAPRPAATSPDPDANPDAESASSDPQAGESQADGDPAPAEKDKRRDRSDHKKRGRRHGSDVKAQIRAREEQVDRALQKLLSVKGHALQLLHDGRRRPPHGDQDEDRNEDRNGDQDGSQDRSQDDDAPARAPHAPARR